MADSWNVKKYDSDFGFVPEYGEGLFNLIEAKEGKLADLGCGTGMLTKRFSDAGFDVVGVDSSEEFISLASQRYPGLKFVVSDISDFHPEDKFDIVFSNAVFHWIDRTRQPFLLSCIAGMLKTGGELVCEFGGFGNNAKVHAHLSEAFERRNLHYKMPFFFPTIGEYVSMLEKYGFMVRYANLFDRPTPLSRIDLAEWIDMFIKRPFDGVLPDDKDKIISDVLSASKKDLFCGGQWILDYVRLRIRAVKLL